MIKNKSALLRRHQNSKILLDLAENALEFLQPKNIIKNQVKLTNNKLIIQNKIFDLKKYKNIYIIGAGKATYKMAVAVNKLLKNKITAGYINVPQVKTKKIGKIVVNKASHPFPNQSGVNGAKQILEIAKKADNNDLVICLMSGGGSALMPLPAKGFMLLEKTKLTDKLLKCSANINEINCVRKHISAIKGGRLAEAALPATIISLYISDVISDDLSTIASGPTVADKTTSQKAISILKKYNINDKKIINIIKNNESPKKIDTKKIFNYIIGNNSQAVEHLIATTKNKKYKVINLGSKIQGEAKLVSRELVNKAKKIKTKKTLLIGGGETTVKVVGNGYGGRNQELVLSALPYLNEKITILSLATDGVDGITPSPVAGGIISKKIKGDITEYLKNNDSYSFLVKNNCLLKTGLTGTNVGDIIMLLIK
ncbi:MAG: DUF4147 domain-containing protein [Patescibacteria group bacterium]